MEEDDRLSREWRENIRKKKKIITWGFSKEEKDFSGQRRYKKCFWWRTQHYKGQDKKGSGMAQSGTWPDARLHPFASVILRPYANWSHSASINPSATPNGPHAVSCPLLLSHSFVSPIFNSPILKLSWGMNTMPPREVTGDEGRERGGPGWRLYVILWRFGFYP